MASEAEVLKPPEPIDSSAPLLDPITGATTRNYRHLKHATKEEWVVMGQAYTVKVDNATSLTETFFSMLKAQKDKGPLGSTIDLYEHNVQTATRCHRAGEDIDIVVMGLFHDVTELLNCKNHGKAAAALLEPYLSPKAAWMLSHHEIFQGYYYFEHFGGDKDTRAKLFGDHEWYQDLADWCEKYDAASFDREYKSEDLEFFRGVCMEVFGREAYWWDEKHVMRGVVTECGSRTRSRSPRLEKQKS